MINILTHISTVNNNYAIKHHYKCNYIYLFIVIQFKLLVKYITSMLFLQVP